jgi:hypothetical protein
MAWLIVVVLPCTPRVCSPSADTDPLTADQHGLATAPPARRVGALPFWAVVPQWLWARWFPFLAAV